jgi:hypothetical protein
MITCPEDNAAVNHMLGQAKFYSVSNKGTFHKPPHFAVHQGSLNNGAYHCASNTIDAHLPWNFEWSHEHMDYFHAQEMEFLKGELVWVYVISQEMCNHMADKFRALPSAKVSSKAEPEAEEEEEEEEEEEKAAEGKAPASRRHGSHSSTPQTGTQCITSIASTQLIFSPTELRHASDRRHTSTAGGDPADQQEA